MKRYVKRIAIVLFIVVLITATVFGITACGDNGDDEIARLEQLIAALQKDLDAAKVNLESTLASLKDLKDYVDAANIEELNLKIAELQQLIDDKTADIEIMNAKLEELKTLIEKLASEYFAFERQKNSLEFRVQYKIEPFTATDLKMELLRNHNILDSQSMTTFTEKIKFKAPFFGKYSIRLSGKRANGYSFSLECDYNVVEPHYNIAYFNATLPVAMYSTQLCLDPESPTFIYLERHQTFDWNNLPENAYQFVGLEDVSKYNFNADVPTAAAYIYELANADKTSTFTVNVTDNYANLIAAFMECNGIDSSRYDAKLWTDGLGTYNVMQSVDPDKATLDKHIVDLNKHIDNALAGNSEEYIAMRDEGSLQCSKYALAYSSRSNVDYIVNSTDGIYNSDAAMKEYVNSHLTVIPLNKMLSDVKADNKAFSSFEFLFKTRWIENGKETSMDSVFNKSSKPNLLILGTSPSGEDGVGKTFMEFYGKLKEKFGAQYDIFYKAHPKYTDLSGYTDNRADVFNTDGVVNIVPGTIPVELFMYFYSDVYICGYMGSSFYSSQKNQTICFFQSKVAVESNTTLKSMMDAGIFDNTVYLYDEMTAA